MILIRNPFDFIWSEYQRRETSSHTGQIPRSDFNANKFKENALELADKYVHAQTIHYKLLRQTYAEKDVIIVRFEALAGHLSRITELRRIVEFLDIPGISDSRRTKISNERLRCAFLLAESSDVSFISSTYSIYLFFFNGFFIIHRHIDQSSGAGRKI